MLNILFSMLLALACASASSAGVQASSAPNRIVSLSPGITEILYALNLGDKVAGDTDYCDYPPAAKLKPHIGDIIVNYEALLALKPDLVIADAAANRAAIPRLQALKAPLEIVTSNSMKQVEAGIAAIAQATGTQLRARIVIAGMERKLRFVSQIAAENRAEPPIKTLVIIGIDPPYVAGTNSFMGDMVLRAGGLDLAGSAAYIPWSKERIVASRPQAIFCDADDKASLMRDPVWRQTPALRSGNVFVTDNAFMRPGPRLADAAVAVANDLNRARR